MLGLLLASMAASLDKRLKGKLSLKADATRQRV
jgi:hypothetical protein